VSSNDPFNFGPATPSNFGTPATSGFDSPATSGFETAASNDWDSGASTPAGALPSPPVIWLIAAIGVGIVAAVLSALFGSAIIVAGLAWFAAGPVAIGLLGLFILRDTKESAKPFYARPSSTTLFYYGALVAAFVGIIVSALQIANWAGRL